MEDEGARRSNRPRASRYSTTEQSLEEGCSTQIAQTNPTGNGEARGEAKQDLRVVPVREPITRERVAPYSVVADGRLRASTGVLESSSELSPPPTPPAATRTWGLRTHPRASEGGRAARIREEPAERAGPTRNPPMPRASEVSLRTTGHHLGGARRKVRQTCSEQVWEGAYSTGTRCLGLSHRRYRFGGLQKRSVNRPCGGRERAARTHDLERGRSGSGLPPLSVLERCTRRTVAQGERFRIGQVSWRIYAPTQRRRRKAMLP